jgi:hypothetical protein
MTAALLHRRSASRPAGITMGHAAREWAETHVIDPRQMIEATQPGRALEPINTDPPEPEATPDVAPVTTGTAPGPTMTPEQFLASLGPQPLVVEDSGWLPLAAGGVALGGLAALGFLFLRRRRAAPPPPPRGSRR